MLASIQRGAGQHKVCLQQAQLEQRHCAAQLAAHLPGLLEEGLWAASSTGESQPKTSDSDTDGNIQTSPSVADTLTHCDDHLVEWTTSEQGKCIVLHMLMTHR
jgi:hypothetical protein